MCRNTLLDDFGLEPFDAPSRMSLLEILEDRVGRRSTVIVSQIPFSSWHQIIGDPTIADATCDRILHTSHRIELKGESMRKKQQPKKSERTQGICPIRGSRHRSPTNPGRRAARP